MGKEVKTNAMRILDRNKIPYEIINYECDEFIDGQHTAEKTGAPVEQSFKRSDTTYRICARRLLSAWHEKAVPDGST